VQICLLRGTLLCGSVLIRFLFFCSEDARSARVADADYFPIEIEASTEPLYYEATNLTRISNLGCKRQWYAGLNLKIVDLLACMDAFFSDQIQVHRMLKEISWRAGSM
jgi:hypothetical protein